MERENREDAPCAENLMGDTVAYGFDDESFQVSLADINPPGGASSAGAPNLFLNQLPIMQRPAKKARVTNVTPTSLKETVPAFNFDDDDNKIISDDSSDHTKNPVIPPRMDECEYLLGFGFDTNILFAETPPRSSSPPFPEGAEGNEPSVPKLPSSSPFPEGAEGNEPSVPKLPEHYVVLFCEGTAPNRATELWKAAKRCRQKQKLTEPPEEGELETVKEHLHNQLKNVLGDSSLPEPQFITKIKDGPYRSTDHIFTIGETVYRQARIRQGEDELEDDLLTFVEKLPDHIVVLGCSTRNPTKALELWRRVVRPKRQRTHKRKPLFANERTLLTVDLHELLKKQILNCQRPVFVVELKKNEDWESPLFRTRDASYRLANDSEFENSLGANDKRPFRLPLNEDTERLAEFLASGENFPGKTEQAGQFRAFVRHVRCQVPCIGAMFQPMYEEACIQAINKAYIALRRKKGGRKKRPAPSSLGDGDRDFDCEDRGDDSRNSEPDSKPGGHTDSMSGGHPNAFNRGFTPSSGAGNGTTRGFNTPCDEYDYSSLSFYTSSSHDSCCSSGYDAAYSESDFDSDECEDSSDDEDFFYESEEVRHETQIKANRLIMRYLQDPSLDLAEQDESGMTLLHKMCSLGHLYYVGWLLYKGVDPLLKTKDDRTALDIARSIGRNEVVELLEESITFRKDHPEETSPEVVNTNNCFQSGISPERPHEYEEMVPSRCTTGEFSIIGLPLCRSSLDPTGTSSQDELTAAPKADCCIERPQVMEKETVSENEAFNESDFLSSEDSLGLKYMESRIITLTDPNDERQQSLSSLENGELEEVPLVTAQLADSLSPDVLPAQEAIASLVEEPPEDTLCQYNGQAAFAGCYGSTDSHERSQLVTALERVVSTVVEGMASLQKQQKDWLESQETFLSRLSRGNSSKTLPLDLPDIRTEPPERNVKHNHRLVNMRRPDPPGLKTEDLEDELHLVRDGTWDEISVQASICFVEAKDAQDQEEEEQGCSLKRDESWDADSVASTICFVQRHDIQGQGPETLQETTPSSCLCHVFVLDADGSQCDKCTTESCCFLDETSSTSFDGKVPALVVLDEMALESSASTSSTCPSSSSPSCVNVREDHRSQPTPSKALKTMFKRTARLLSRMNLTATQ